MPPRPKRRRPITLATVAGGLSFIIPSLALTDSYIRTRNHWPVVYFLLISIITFLVYGHDKLQAKHLNYRTPEKYLHVLGMLGGWPGGLIGQHYFQHKTRKSIFQVPFWGIVMWWQVIVYVGYFRGE